MKIKDLVRTTIVCRHIDEPQRIANKIECFAREHGLTCKVNPHAKEEGYYAYHIYVGFEARLLDPSWEEFDVEMYFEIQVTTEMQYMLYELTHVFYGQERHEEAAHRKDWKWKYDTHRFSASYISHSLHLLQGLILRLYEDVGKKNFQKCKSPDEDNPLEVAEEKKES